MKPLPMRIDDCVAQLGYDPIQDPANGEFNLSAGLKFVRAVGYDVVGHYLNKGDTRTRKSILHVVSELSPKDTRGLVAPILEYLGGESYWDNAHILEAIKDHATDLHEPDLLKCLVLSGQGVPAYEIRLVVVFGNSNIKRLKNTVAMLDDGELREDISKLVSYLDYSVEQAMDKLKQDDDGNIGRVLLCSIIFKNFERFSPSYEPPKYKDDLVQYSIELAQGKYRRKNKVPIRRRGSG